MLATATALALLALADPPARKAPPTKEELAAIVERGRNLAGYDAAAWHASDALEAKEKKIRPGRVARYIARKDRQGWTVAFGRLDEATGRFLIAYEATQGKDPAHFSVKAFEPPKEDAEFFRSAARAIDLALKDFTEHFAGERRPYNVAVLPAEKGDLWVYLVPAPAEEGVWPLGGDVRYRISADGSKIIAKRQLHRSVIEYRQPPAAGGNQLVAGMHTHILDDVPEDTDVFHVLTRVPHVPELIRTKHFLFAVESDGVIKYQGRADEVLEK